MKVCPRCGYVDRSHWRQNRWRTNVEFLKFRDYPEDIDLEILKRLLAGHKVVTDKFYAYRLSGDVVERVLKIDYEVAGMNAFHIPREHIDHKVDPFQLKLFERRGRL